MRWACTWLRLAADSAVQADYQRAVKPPETRCWFQFGSTSSAEALAPNRAIASSRAPTVAVRLLLTS
jgi:hypothetical protein